MAVVDVAAIAQVTGRSAPGHQPLDHNAPPGVAGRWARIVGRSTPGYLQPIRVHLPTKGTITFYQSPSNAAQSAQEISARAPALARVAVGAVYRIRIADMPEYPGQMFYPSLEIIDRLHPPAGKADQFPVPIRFTAEEIEQASRGRMVTKIVYLEQPQLASGHESPVPTETIPPHRNLLTAADRRGRPMAIIRLGGRQPSERSGSAFFGRGGPVQLPGKQPK